MAGSKNMGSPKHPKKTIGFSDYGLGYPYYLGHFKKQDQYMYMYVCKYISLSISLSISTYIYIYTQFSEFFSWAPPNAAQQGTGHRGHLVNLLRDQR